MSGIKALRRIKLGRESTAGTAVAATDIWRGMGLLSDDREIKIVEEQVGYLLPTTRAYVPKLAASVKFDPIEATYPQLPHILEAAIRTDTPASDGSGYVYEYIVPIDTAPSATTIKTYTIEGGNNQLVQEMEYSFVEKFKLSGNQAEGVMMEADWIGRRAIDSSFTSLSPAALVPSDQIIFGGSDLYIDSSTVGTTEVTSTLLKFELEVTTGLRPKWTNEFKYFDFIYFDIGSFSATLKVTYEHNNTADAERNHFEAGTPRIVRLEFPGAALGTPGVTYSNYLLRIDCAGVYTEFKQSDVDGNDVVEATLQIGHDIAENLGLTIIVVNEDSAIP